MPRTSDKQPAAGSALRRTPAPQTRPRPIDCPGCRVRVLKATTTTGLDVVVDALPLSARGEVSATLAGRATYTWHRVPDHLVRRYPLVMEHRPAGTPRQTVHPAHVCGDSWPALTPPPGVTPTPGSADLPPY